MDDATRTGVVDTSLSLGLVGFSPDYDDAALREDPGRVANGVNGGVSTKKESMVSVREFERVISEKKKLETLLLVLSGKNNSPVDRFSDRRNEVFLQKPQDRAFSKRKVEYCNDEVSWKRQRESNRCRIRKVFYQVDASDMSLVVKDGYQWRKYGQKVTRDNPSPRAYFKCSFAPSCQVKKKVQRSVDNPRILVATYEGEHNHRSPSHASTSSLRSDSLASFRSMPSLPSAKSPSPTATSSSITQQTKVEALPKVLIQQMATSLTRDPVFTSAIAAAISQTVLSQMLAQTDSDRSSQ